eukprot:33492_1
MSLSDIFATVKLERGQKFNYYLQKPSYHSNNKDVVIISTHCKEGTNKKGIYEYNLTQNTFNKIHTYGQTFNPSYQGQFNSVLRNCRYRPL